MKHIGRLLIAALAFLAAPAIAQIADYSNPVQTVTFAITPTTGVRTAGDCLGTTQVGYGMLRPGGPGGSVVVGITTIDTAAQSAANNALNIWIFNAAPTGTYTDKTACNVAAADQPNLVGVIVTASTDCVIDKTPSVTICTKNVVIPVSGTAGSSLWFQANTVATPNFGTNTYYIKVKAQPN